MYAEFALGVRNLVTGCGNLCGAGSSSVIFILSLAVRDLFSQENIFGELSFFGSVPAEFKLLNGLSVAVCPIAFAELSLFWARSNLTYLSDCDDIGGTCQNPNEVPADCGFSVLNMGLSLFGLDTVHFSTEILPS
jgi:hypothetical protein